MFRFLLKTVFALALFNSVLNQNYNYYNNGYNNNNWYNQNNYHQVNPYLNNQVGYGYNPLFGRNYQRFAFNPYNYFLNNKLPQNYDEGLNTTYEGGYYNDYNVVNNGYGRNGVFGNNLIGQGYQNDEQVRVNYIDM